MTHLSPCISTSWCQRFWAWQFLTPDNATWYMSHGPGRFSSKKKTVLHPDIFDLPSCKLFSWYWFLLHSLVDSDIWLSSIKNQHISPVKGNHIFHAGSLTQKNALAVNLCWASNEISGFCEWVFFTGVLFSHMMGGIWRRQSTAMSTRTPRNMSATWSYFIIFPKKWWLESKEFSDP